MNLNARFTKLMVLLISTAILLSALGTLPFKVGDTTKELQSTKDIEEINTNDDSNLLENRGTRASQRTVIAELFTNWDCSACPPANHAIEELLDVYDRSQLVMISYHVNWPGSDDPFYLFNSPDVNNRKNYYGVSAVPYMMFDGPPQVSPNSYSNYKSTIESELAILSPLTITLNGNLNTMSNTGTVDATIEVTDTLPAGTKVIRFAIVEDNKYADGSYVDRHRYVMRDMLAEESLTISSVGEFQTVSRTFPLDEIYDLNSTSIVVFVQNDNNKDVLQAAMYDYIPQTILVVDDDQSPNPQGYEDDYHLLLCYMEYAFDGWVLNEKGSPSSKDLENYDIVIWITADTSTSTLTTADQTAISDYLDTGIGNLFLCGESVGLDIGSEPFFNEYLHADFVTDDTNQNQITGVENDPISGPFDGSTLPVSDNSPSEINPGEGASTIFYYSPSAQSGAIRAEHDEDSKVVYFAFLYFEDFPGTDTLSRKATVMEAVLGWFEYTVIIPSNVTLYPGWNLMSIPLIQEDTSIHDVLQSIDGEYDTIQCYDAVDKTDNWKHYQKSKPSHMNDLEELTHEIGFWINIVNTSNVTYNFQGTIPVSNQIIYLNIGWNLIGYPSFTDKDRTTALNNIGFGKEVDSIWGFNGETQQWEEMGPSDKFEVGRGYWIHSLDKVNWVVPL